MPRHERASSPSERITMMRVSVARLPLPARAWPWSTLYRVGGVAALAVVALIPIQGTVYVLNPPPSTVAEYFALFTRSLLQGLLALDLLLLVDYALLLLVYLALV